MDILNQAMFYLLGLFKNVLGSYGWAIIALTVAFRLIVWPLNTKQTLEMQKMQQLQPKIKALQERYKNEPQKMQEQMMVFYKENKFNPFGGCLPMLIQLPVFIGLYGMLVSPDFLAASGNTPFLFLENLSRPLNSHSGKSLDGTFNITEKDHFVTAHHIDVDLVNGQRITYKITDPQKVLSIQPMPLIPGDPLSLSLDGDKLGETGFSDAFIEGKVAKASVVVVNDSTKEVESVVFTPKPLKAATVADPNTHAVALMSEIPTVMGKSHFHMGLLYLVIAYALLTVLYQMVMSKATPASEASGPQAQMMKLMPLMFVGFLVFLPIPAGVVLYLVVTMLLMFLQTAWINANHPSNKPDPNAKPGQQVVDVKPA